jgi:hypothetical protein
MAARWRAPSPRPSSVALVGRIGATLAAMLVTLCLVAPVWAGEGPTSLSDASASPRSGTTTTTIRVTVTYRNREGSAADWVRVTLAGMTRTMVRTAGTDWRRGVQYSWAGRLPVGKHAITIEALSRDRFSDTVSAGSVTIKRAATPAPTPAPTPKPTPKPTARPTATAAPAASPSGTASPTPTPSPLPAWTLGPVPSDGAIAFILDGVGGAPGAWRGGDPGSNGAPAGPDAPDGAGALAAAIDLITSGHPTIPLGLAATVAATSSAVGAALALGLFTRRRREGEPPYADDILADHAASPLAVESASAYARQGGKAPPVATVANAPAPLQGELAMPRWRRPSLLEARRADPLRDATAAPRLTFDHGLVGPLDGRERRLIRYTLVRLLDIPDELRGTELAFLDQGDEVQLLEKRGVYWLVLCPDGRQGWIHKMTLGEVIGDPSTTPSAPTATMPIAADTWTMGDDVDGDVLTAYLESRRRA